MWNAIACAALIVAIVGLLLATWMPAIVAARTKKESATQPSPTTGPTTLPITPPTTAPATQP